VSQEDKEQQLERMKKLKEMYGDASALSQIKKDAKH
jgi:hypothetical protein